MSKNQMPKPPGQRPEELEDQNLDIEQPELDLPPANEEQKIAPKPVSKRKMKVRATRAGFIHSERKVEGDIFEVNAGLIGSWFEYQDPIEQKKHLQKLADKKKKANARGIQDHEDELADE